MYRWEMFIDFFLIAGMSFLAFLILVLIKSKVHFSKTILNIFFINAFFFLLYYYSYLHKIRITGGIAILFGHGVGYLLGPSFLYLVKSLVFSKEKILRPYLKSLIPFAFVFIFCNVPLCLAMTSDYFDSYHNIYITLEIPFNILENIFIIFYIFKTLKFLNRLKISIQENYANLSSQNLQWYKHFIIGFSVIVIIDSLLSVYEFFFTVDLWNVGTVIAFMLFFLYLYLGYKGLYQAQILIPSFLLDQLDETQSPSKTPILDTDTTTEKEKTIVRQLDSLKPQEIENLKQKLNILLTEDKVYLNEDLNLTQLSEYMDISNKKLSELLNHHLNTNFYDLINEYRINAIKQRFENGDAEKYTIISIAYDAGFKSKASFYRIFKQKEGISPSNYNKKFQEVS
ncbi:helix-turn-helix domain-containing protein [Winogradskyella psychrotolerans]|uniref:helix-turn-helix domain-containing protein n=1 Tax=Winogradskyella psychrotolerans TaxID=1344585 RepID=UPI001C068C48|nr:helix-turn-helix domain-containing protein [Winogradskyella psychrotolerans]MBU2928120.1 AraC family transcriptional regulator [Winogradskyella psychrotolerans]